MARAGFVSILETMVFQHFAPRFRRFRMLTLRLQFRIKPPHGPVHDPIGQAAELRRKYGNPPRAGVPWSPVLGATG